MNLLSFITAWAVSYTAAMPCALLSKKGTGHCCCIGHSPCRLSSHNLGNAYTPPNPIIWYGKRRTICIVCISWCHGQQWRCDSAKSMSPHKQLIKAIHFSAWTIQHIGIFFLEGCHLVRSRVSVPGSKGNGNSELEQVLLPDPIAGAVYLAALMLLG